MGSWGRGPKTPSHPHSHSRTPQTTPQLLARNPSPTTPCIINVPKNHKILSKQHSPAKITKTASETTPKGPSKHHKCPQEPQKPLPVPQGAPRPPPTPHGTDQDRLGDRNIHSPEQLGHFSSDLGTLEVTPQRGRPRAGTGTDNRNSWRTDGRRWTRSASTTVRLWPQSACIRSPTTLGSS